MHTGEELQLAHRRMVELLRQSRPQSPELVPAWSSGSSTGQPDPSLRYVDEAAIHHITLGWMTTGDDDLESDDVAISDWLGDCPQDILTNTAAKILGLARLEKLTDAAEAAGDQWLLARRAVLAADLARIASDTAAKLGWWRRALDALGELASGNASPDRQMQELMEMKVFCILSAASDPADAKYLPRVQYLLELEHTDSSPIHKCMCKQFEVAQKMFADVTSYPTGFIGQIGFASRGCRTHPDPRMQNSCAFMVVVSGMNQPSFTADGWDWDETYMGADGKTTILKQATELYDFDSCHKYVLSEMWGADWLVCNPNPSLVMANHYGELHESVCHYERMMPLVDRVLQQPNQGEEATTILLFFWASYALDMKRPGPCLRAMDKLQLTWQEADATVARQLPHITLPFSQDWCSLVHKASYVMLGGSTGDDSVDEIVAILPTWDEHIEIAKLGYVHCDV